MIDLYHLDDEIKKHLTEFEEVSQKYAPAKSREGATKAEIEKVYAGLYSQYYYAAHAEGKTVSGQTLESLVKNTPEYAKAIADHQEASAEFDKIHARRNYLYAKETMIRLAVDLYKSSYFALPGDVTR